MRSFAAAIAFFTLGLFGLNLASPVTAAQIDLN
ncbi:MAG: hypothetical protein V7609_1219 [Verrucomicrobiota bacterium]